MTVRTLQENSRNVNSSLNCLLTRRIKKQNKKAQVHFEKLYLGPIHLADLGSTQSTVIYLGVLLIHLQMPQLVLGLLRSKPKPVSKSRFMSKYPDRIWIFVWVLRPDFALL